MADVTISSLTRGTPNGNNIIPYSNGSSTLGASVSALFEGTNKVGIGVNPNLFNNSLVIKGVDSATFTGNQPLGLGLLNGGNYDLTGIDFKNLTGNSLAGRIGVEVTGAGGYMKFGTSNNYSIGITNTALTIDPSGIIAKPSQPAFAVRANTHNVVFTTPANYAKINLPNVLFNQGNYWNENLQRFNAPASGIYSFSGMLRMNTLPTNWFYPMLVINNISYFDLTGGALPGLANIPTTWSAVTSNFHQLVKLNANDYVEFKVGMSNNGTYNIDGQSVFYGYLLG